MLQGKEREHALKKIAVQEAVNREKMSKILRWASSGDRTIDFKNMELAQMATNIGQIYGMLDKFYDTLFFSGAGLAIYSEGSKYEVTLPETGGIFTAEYIGSERQCVGEVILGTTAGLVDERTKAMNLPEMNSIKLTLKNDNNGHVRNDRACFSMTDKQGKTAEFAGASMFADFVSCNYLFNLVENLDIAKVIYNEKLATPIATEKGGLKSVQEIVPLGNA